MSESEVRRECHKLGWELASDWNEAGGVQPVVYKPAKAPHERVEIGRGITPEAAYHDACEREQVSPF